MEQQPSQNSSPETTEATPDGGPASHVEDAFYVSPRVHLSVRGVLAVVTFGMAFSLLLRGLKIEEPLYSLLLLIAGAYFGNRKGK